MDNESTRESRFTPSMSAVSGTRTGVPNSHPGIGTGGSILGGADAGGVASIEIAAWSTAVCSTATGAPASRSSAGEDPTGSVSAPAAQPTTKSQIPATLIPPRYAPTPISNPSERGSRSQAPKNVRSPAPPPHESLQERPLNERATRNRRRSSQSRARRWLRCPSRERRFRRHWRRTACARCRLRPSPDQWRR